MKALKNELTSFSILKSLFGALIFLIADFIVIAILMILLEFVFPTADTSTTSLGFMVISISCITLPPLSVIALELISLGGYVSTKNNTFYNYSLIDKIVSLILGFILFIVLYFTINSIGISVDYAKLVDTANEAAPRYTTIFEISLLFASVIYIPRTLVFIVSQFIVIPIKYTLIKKPSVGNLNNPLNL